MFHCACRICFLALQASDLALITAYFQAQLIAGQVGVVCVCQPDLTGVFFESWSSVRPRVSIKTISTAEAYLHL